MFALLGEIPFQMVGSPEELRDSRRYDYAEHRVVQARPQLQWLADDLMRIELEMLLHSSFTDPAANLLALTEAAAAHSVLPLVFGNGDFRGYFVISEIRTISRQLSGSGAMFAISVHLRLTESPVDFDPTAPPVLPFIPLALSSLSSRTSNPSVLVPAGVSALASITLPAGSPSAIVLPDDIAPSAIVRSAL